MRRRVRRWVRRWVRRQKASLGRRRRSLIGMLRGSTADDAHVNVAMAVEAGRAAAQRLLRVVNCESADPASPGTDGGGSRGPLRSRAGDKCRGGAAAAAGLGRPRPPRRAAPAPPSPRTPRATCCPPPRLSPRRLPSEESFRLHSARTSQLLKTETLKSAPGLRCPIQT